MNNILFLFPNIPISENAAGGGGIVFRNHLELLRQEFSEIHLVQLINGNDPDHFDAYFKTNPREHEIISELFSSREIVRLSGPSGTSRLRNYSNIAASPARFAFPFLTAENKAILLRLFNKYKPSLIWAEHLAAGLLSRHFLTGLGVPVIYSHHDWEYKLRALRNHQKQNSFRYKVITALTRREEFRLVKRTTAVVTCSYSECIECKSIGAANALYLPLFVSSPPSITSQAAKPAKFRIFHLGGMQTTSNRIGLANFFTFCWAEIKKRIPSVELMLIGNTDNAGPELSSYLEDAAVVRTGYVTNAEELLEPYSFHIIPWDRNTGIRTKVPLVMRNRQIVVGFEEGLSGFWELADKENVLIARNFEEMTTLIIQGFENPQLLEKLGNAAYETYSSNFTKERVTERFKSFIQLFKRSV